MRHELNLICPKFEIIAFSSNTYIPQAIWLYWFRLIVKARLNICGVWYAHIRRILKNVHLAAHRCGGSPERACADDTALQRSVPPRPKQRTKSSYQTNEKTVDTYKIAHGKIHPYTHIQTKRTQKVRSVGACRTIWLMAAGRWGEGAMGLAYKRGLSEQARTNADTCTGACRHGTHVYARPRCNSCLSPTLHHCMHARSHARRLPTVHGRGRASPHAGCESSVHIWLTDVKRRSRTTEPPLLQMCVLLCTYSCIIFCIKIKYIIFLWAGGTGKGLGLEHRAAEQRRGGHVPPMHPTQCDTDWHRLGIFVSTHADTFLLWLLITCLENRLTSLLAVRP